MVLSEFFTEAVLPFLLVFVVVFAVLQRSEVLGEGKKQIDALVALVIGLILISVPFARDIVVNLMPWVAVGISVLLTFFILYGFVGGKMIDSQGGGKKWMKITFGILIGIFTLVIVLYVTGLWELIEELFSDVGDNFVSEVILIIIVIGAFVVAITTGGGSDSKGKDKSDD